MILAPYPYTYDQFKVMHSTLVNKHDDTVVYMIFENSPTHVIRIAAVFSKTPDIRIDVGFGNQNLTVATLLNDFPDAVAVYGISVGA